MSQAPVVGFQKEELRKSADLVKSKDPVTVNKHTLTILQLSDLHFDFGKSFRFAKAPGNSDAPSLATMVAEALSSAELSADAVIISGDFGFKNTHYELQNHAKREMESLRDTLNVPFQSWVVIPGNHDIDWGSEKYDKADKSPIYPGKTRDYFEYVYRRVELEKKCALQEELKLWSSDSDDQWRTERKNGPIRYYMPSCATFQMQSGRLIEIHGYNSCLVEGADWPGIGFVGDGQPRFFEYLSGAAEASSKIKIAVLHHHVKEVSTIIQLPEGEKLEDRMQFSLIADSRRLLDRLIRNGYGMLLHGHQHQPFISQETRPCYAKDPSSDTWYRDYVDEKLLIFGAGSVSFWPADETRVDNAFFVHQIDDEDSAVTTWNFTMGASDDKFQRREPCRQFLRGTFTPEFIRKRLCLSLGFVERANPADGEMKIPQPCEAVDRVLGNGLQELLTAIGALTHSGQRYELNLLLTQPGDDRNRGGTTNLPARFATLLRLALKYRLPLFPNYWTLPPDREQQPHIFNIIRWASLNLAKGVLGKDSHKYFKDLKFEKQVLSEYPGEMEIPSDLCPARYFLACVVIRQTADKRIELLLRGNDEWKAKLLPVIEVSESKSKQWEVGTAASRLVLARPVFAGIISSSDRCEIVEFPPGTANVQKKQISPSKGLWNHYSFNLCFVKFDASARKALAEDESFTFLPVDQIQKIWDDAANEAEQGDLTWLKQPIKRAAVANRKLIESVLKVLKNPDSNWFYELA